MLLVMYKVAVKNHLRKIVAYDLKDNCKRIGYSWVEDPEIIGRFVANMFTFVNGHLYFDNQVFKLRYDIMIKTKSESINEKHFIDKYDNILDLKVGEKVMTNMPKLSLVSHK